jgi:hypothetical protein
VCGERLEAGDREQPSRNGGTAFKAASRLPHVEEHVAQNVLGHGLIADKPEQSTIDISPMPGEQPSSGRRPLRDESFDLEFDKELRLVKKRMVRKVGWAASAVSPRQTATGWGKSTRVGAEHFLMGDVVCAKRRAFAWED